MFTCTVPTVYTSTITALQVSGSTHVCCSEHLCSVGKVDRQAFVKMKCYATVLPDVPREISSQSPVDAG